MPEVRKKYDISLLGSVNANRVGPRAFSLIRSLDNMEPSEQLAGYGIAFLALCKRLNARPIDVLNYSDRIIAVAGEHVPEVRALQMYINEET